MVTKRQKEILKRIIQKKQAEITEKVYPGLVFDEDTDRIKIEDIPGWFFNYRWWLAGWMGKRGEANWVMYALLNIGDPRLH